MIYIFFNITFVDLNSIICFQEKLDIPYTYKQIVFFEFRYFVIVHFYNNSLVFCLYCKHLFFPYVYFQGTTLLV